MDFEIKRIKYYHLRFPDGDTVRIVRDTAGDVPKTLLGKTATIREINYEETAERGVVCYDVMVKGRKNAKMVQHDDLERVVERD